MPLGEVGLEVLDQHLPGVLHPAQDLGRQVTELLLARLVEPRRPAARRLAHQHDANAAVLGGGRKPADAA